PQRRANQSAWRCGGRIGGEKCHLCIRFKVLPIYRLDKGEGQRNIKHKYPNAGAAPHPAAATFSPYSDGEKGDTLATLTFFG
ncbi:MULTISPECIES: hypothetical protein, partial [unclassified Mesorhizobium]